MEAVKLGWKPRPKLGSRVEPRREAVKDAGGKEPAERPVPSQVGSQARSQECWVLEPGEEPSSQVAKQPSSQVLEPGEARYLGKWLLGSSVAWGADVPRSPEGC